MQELTGTALDYFSFNTHNVGGVVIGGRSPKSISQLHSKNMNPLTDTMSINTVRAMSTQKLIYRGR